MFRSTLATLFFAATVSAQTPKPVYTLETEHGTITYTSDGEFAVTEGDIILGTVEEIQSRKALSPRSLTVITSGSTQLWPNATMYYTLDGDVPNPQFMLDAIDHWNTRTPLKILPRTGQANYVRFQRTSGDAACSSFIGMVGGAQAINVTTGCSTGSAIHEIGHAFGLLHEQQRKDRGGNLTVLYENIDKRYISNYPQSTSSTDAAYYDFDSIMHYGPDGFSRNYLDTLETVPPGIPLGQRNLLSAGDIDGVIRLYKLPVTTTTITTTPAGLNITVDGTTAPSPQTFTWATGSQHTVSVDTVIGADPRYLFSRWTDGGAATHTITASAEVTAFSAHFARQHPMRVGVSSGQGTVSSFPAATDGYLNERVRFAVTATPAAGYEFLRWTGTTYLGVNGQSISANPALVQLENGLSDYRAIFTNGPVTTIDSDPRGAQVNVDGTTYLTPVRLAWTAGTTHTVTAATSQLFGNNTTRMLFRNWEDGGTGARTLTAKDTSATYTATFTRQHLLSTSTSGSGSITATPPSDDGFYDADTAVTLTALPLGTQTLRYWSGDVSGGALASTITMNQQRSATAFFGTAVPFRLLSSASYLPHPSVGTVSSLVVPGEIVAIFASAPATDFGPATGIFGTIDASGKLPFSLGGVTVTFDGLAAPILYVSKTQLNVVVPYAVAGRTTSIVQIAGPTTTYTTTLAVGTTAPALFTYDGSGSGQVAALNENGTVNSPANPAPAGSVVVLYATGAGLFDKNFADGQILGGDLGRPVLPVWVRFGKQPADILYAGTAPFLVNGAMQVNVRLPADLIGTATVPVQLIIGTYASQVGATISVANPLR